MHHICGEFELTYSSSRIAQSNNEKVGTDEKFVVVSTRYPYIAHVCVYVTMEPLLKLTHNTTQQPKYVC